LVDPFAGSGTVPIEAGLIAAGRAPGASREFAFQRWPTFEPGTWASVRAEVGAGGEPVASSPIAGSDRDAGVVDDARANAERAGVAELVPFERRAVSDAVPVGDGAGLLVTNPPYGGRASPGADLRNLYARFG